jgi:hypothetical protein
MSLWGKPVTRHYTHEYPALAGTMLKALLALQPDQGVYATSRRGLRVDIIRLYPDGEPPCFRARLMNGQVQTIHIEHTRTAFNGLRWWYACPYCSRRCSKLYWTRSAIACRQCLNLHYQSQSETPRDRLLRRIRNERYAIWREDEPGINNLFIAPHLFPKPDGMHWCTFEEKRSRLMQRESRYFAALRYRLDHGRL